MDEHILIFLIQKEPIPNKKLMSYTHITHYRQGIIDVKFAENLNSLDNICLSNICKLDGNKIFSILFPWISHSANGYYYPIIPIILFLLNYDIAISFLLSGVAAFAIELPACRIIKHGIKRTRPFEVLAMVHNRVYPSDRFSLPSGHTAAAFLVAVLMSHSYPVLIFPSFIWATLVGMSRIYLGVHYPTDILAGMAVGILSGLTGIQLAGQLL